MAVEKFREPIEEDLSEESSIDARRVSARRHGFDKRFKKIIYLISRIFLKLQRPFRIIPIVAEKVPISESVGHVPNIVYVRWNGIFIRSPAVNVAGEHRNPVGNRVETDFVVAEKFDAAELVEDQPSSQWQLTDRI